MKRLSGFGEICLLISSPADRRLLADLLEQTGYRVRIIAPHDPAAAGAALLIADEVSARHAGAALLHWKLQQQPLYFPMLLTLSGNASSTPWLRAGYDDVLRLPLKKDDLLARLEAFLRLRRHSEDILRDSTLRFSTTFDLVPAGIIHVDVNGRLQHGNPRFCEMFGYAESEVPGLSVNALEDPAEAFVMRRAIDFLINADEAVVSRFDHRCRRKDGVPVWVSIAMTLMRDTGRVPRQLVAVMEDIGTRKRLENSLRESEWFIKSTIDALATHICVLDENGDILEANKAWHDFSAANGLRAEAARTRANYLAVCGRATGMGAGDAAAFAAGMREVAGGGRKEFSLEYTCELRAEQAWFIARVTRFPHEGPLRLVVAHVDITQSKKSERELFYLANYDGMTGLPNRSLLLDRLCQAIAHASRHAQQLRLLSFGIDRFKEVIDSVGHKAGDILLNTISRRLQDVTRDTDTVARFGSDEFIVVLSEPSDDGLTRTIIGRIMEAVAQPLALGGHEVFLTASIGIAVYPNDGLDPETLIDHAEIALHRAKRLGHSSYQFYDAAMNQDARARMRLELDMRDALKRDEFVLHYQPQVDLCTGAIVGAEALIRWRHPTLGMISPGSFIALAEETGLIVPIGAWVMRTACAQNKAWHDAGLGPIRVAVNLSARQFTQRQLAEAIAAVLEQTGLPARYLDIELTETLVMSDVEQTIDVLRSMKALGVQLSIDDFGTGYSSLSYLKRFPIDVLKIDQSFVRDITADRGNAAIANAIISMAHSLGIEVVAEGVESEAQCDFLSRNMCDEIQGYWFAKPLPPDQLGNLLAERRSLPPHLRRMHAPKRTLLLVDDELHVLSSLKRLLRNDGYTLLTANSGREGLEVLAANGVDVILSDQRMPDMTGVAFLRAAKERYPDTVRLVLSGYTELQSVTDAVNEGSIYRFLTKPWDGEQLRKHIAEAFGYKEMMDENRRLGMKVQAANMELAANNRRLEGELQRQRDQILESEARLAMLREGIDHTPLPIIGVDPAGRIDFVNDAAGALFKGAGGAGPLLGAGLQAMLPTVHRATANAEEGHGRMVEIDGQPFLVIWRRLASPSRPDAKLILLPRFDIAAHVKTIAGVDPDTHDLVTSMPLRNPSA